MTTSNQEQSEGNENQSGANSERGFDSIDSDKQQDIAAKDGRAAHVSRKAHEFTPEEAREAGAKSHAGPGASGAGSGSDSDVDSKAHRAQATSSLQAPAAKATRTTIADRAGRDRFLRTPSYS